MRFSCCLSQRSDILSQAVWPVKFAAIVIRLSTGSLAEKVRCACRIAHLQPACGGPFSAQRSATLCHPVRDVKFGRLVFQAHRSSLASLRRLTVDAVTGLPLPGRYVGTEIGATIGDFITALSGCQIQRSRPSTPRRPVGSQRVCLGQRRLAVAMEARIAPLGGRCRCRPAASGALVWMSTVTGATMTTLPHAFGRVKFCSIAS
jgi:hypothetical protein